MFTGLIREIARVVSRKNEQLRLAAHYRPAVGDSIAVNGACLTVTRLFDDGFETQLSHETERVIAVENLKSRVHIEAALAVGERLEGHIVQGHIDALGTIARVVRQAKNCDIWIRTDAQTMRLIAPKGSIAIDGVSLTVSEIDNDSFRLTLIEHTLDNTLINGYEVSRRVNIETDLFARYTARLLGCDHTHTLDRARTRDHTWQQIDLINAMF